MSQDAKEFCVFIIFAVSLLFCLTFTGCSIINSAIGLPDDNPIEQSIEDLIEFEIERFVPIKVDIDLTP